MNDFFETCFKIEIFYKILFSGMRYLSKWAGLVLRIEGGRNAFKILIGNLQERNH